MKPGKPVASFSVKDGQEVVLRTPRWENLDDLLELINLLVEEKADVLRSEKVSREEEIDWLSKVLAKLEKDEAFYVVAEVSGRVVGVCEINRGRGYEAHVGVIGIAIRKEFRDLGIGAKMMETLIEQGRKMVLKVLTLSAFASNKRAIRVYEKAGFVQTGRIPKKHFKEGRYIDAIIMTRLLE
jgi:RimJ/RimL family protein N-acetyltransferase